MKPNEARNLNAEDIKEAVSERRQELLDLRFQAAVGQATNPRRIRAAKREIALLLTVAREKEQSS
jgi:large subunit ribosomal protein L29